MQGDLILLILVLFPMAMAGVTYVLGKWTKIDGTVAAIGTGVPEFLFMLYGVLALGTGDLYVPEVCGMGLHFTLEGFRCVYGLVAAFMWMMTLLFSREYMAHEEHRGGTFSPAPARPDCAPPASAPGSRTSGAGTRPPCSRKG